MPSIKLMIMTMVLSLSMAGCSTIKGVGEDLKTVGGWISNGSEHVKESIKNNPPNSKKNMLDGEDSTSLKNDYLIDME